jgi:hypothetical protein
VTLTELDAKIVFTETSEVVWEEATVDASTARNFHDLFQLCQNKINSFRNVNNGTLLTLYLENIELNDDREKRTLDGELLELLLDGEKDEESFVWIVDLIVSESLHLDKEQLKTEANFYAELFEITEQYSDIGETLAPLYEHHLGRKYLSQLSGSEQKELIQNAEKLLIKLLYQ